MSEVTIPLTVQMTVAESVTAYTMTVSESVTQYDMTLESGVTVAYPVYTGAVTVTPTQQTQVLATNGTMLNDNITIEPIPSNYGLITWDGSTLMVS